MGQIANNMKKGKNIPYTVGKEEPPISLLHESNAGYSIKSKKNVKDPISVYMHPLLRSLIMLGLQRHSGMDKITNKSAFIAYIRNGIPKKAIDTMMSIAGFSATEMADMLHTTDRTLRRYTSDQSLNPEQSERLIELAHLYTRGEDVFGNMSNFKIWMDAPVAALGNQKPKSFLDTSMGIHLIMDELGRIEHGIFA